MTGSVVLAAHAKLNLTLEVLGRRDDGYHELRSVFAIVSLADRVRVSRSHALDVKVVPDPAAGDGELCARAVRAYAAAAGRPPLAHVRVRKRIAVAAGLGGGSSDAGATLRGLSAVWRDERDLTPIATTIGSDVPFFVSGAAVARVSGRGEIVEPLPPLEDIWVTVVTLRARVQTPAVFAALRREEWSDGGATDKLSDLLRRGGATPDVLRAMTRNDLTVAAERVCPEIADVRARARDRGVALALSGSGPTLFHIADDRADALRVARILRRGGSGAAALRLGA